MPARKNRPNKFRGDKGAPQLAPKRTPLIDKLIAWERVNPGDDHYVGWPDMKEAQDLARRGWLKESTWTLGCFYVTDGFRAAVMGTRPAENV